MKTLYLLRHAKSSWDEPGLPDFDRPLNKRGEKAAPLMGKVMRERKVRPDVVLCSPAKRTKQTAKLALKAAKSDLDVVFDERLYLASENQLRKVLSELDDLVEAVLLVGHNPDLEDLLEYLTGDCEGMVTGTLASLTLNIKHWSDSLEGNGKLDWLVKPKDLMESPAEHN